MVNIVLATCTGLLMVSTFHYCVWQNNGSSKIFMSETLEGENISIYMAKGN